MRSPELPGYYVGVGSADTGNPAEDRHTAEARARADLASRISVQISGDMTVRTQDDSDGDYSQEVEELVQQSVEKNIKDIQTVDTYYCSSLGTWVYVRLSRQRWEDIQTERRRELLSRVRDLLEPVLKGRSSPLSQRLDRLVRAFELLQDSPLGFELEAEIAGLSGNLSDGIKNEVNRQVGELRLIPEKSEYRSQYGSPIEIRGRLESTSGAGLDRLPIEMYGPENLSVASTVTDGDGSFVLRMPEGLPRAGDFKMRLSTNLGIPDRVRGTILSTALPMAEIDLRLSRIPVGMSLEIRNAAVSRGVEEEVRALFAENGLPFDFVESGNDGGTKLRVVIFVENFPRVMENAPLMAQAWAVVSLEQNGTVLYSYESETVKDGGIDQNQSHSRVLTKLLQSLRVDEELFEGLSTVL